MFTVGARFGLLGGFLLFAILFFFIFFLLWGRFGLTLKYCPIESFSRNNQPISQCSTNHMTMVLFVVFTSCNMFLLTKVSTHKEAQRKNYSVAPANTVLPDQFIYIFNRAMICSVVFIAPISP